MVQSKSSRTFQTKFIIVSEAKGGKIDLGANYLEYPCAAELELSNHLIIHSSILTNNLKTIYLFYILPVQMTSWSDDVQNTLNSRQNIS